MEERLGFYEAVYALVELVPRGRVCTYGRIAAMLGSPRAARAVGYALFNLRHEGAQRVPWQRVINAQGGISARGDAVRAELQRRLLESEGVQFEDDETVSLRRYLWEGPELIGPK